MLKRLSLSLVTLALIAGCTGSDPFKPSAIISNVEPNRGASGRTLQVEIHGDFTKWKASSIEAGDVTFGDGVTVDSLTVANEGFLVATISIAPNAPLGAHDVDVDGETAVGVFQVVPPFTIEETVYAGGYGFITIIGEGTDWLDGITNVTTPSDELFVYDFSVEAPNVIRALVVADLFMAAGGIDIAVNGITTDDAVPGVLTVATVTPIVLSASANANGTVGGNGLVVLRIPAGAIGDTSDITFLDTTTDPDIDTLIFSEDEGLIPLFDPDNGDTYSSLAFGNGDKDIYVTVQDYYNAGPELPFEYDFVKTSLNPTQLAAQAAAQTIPAANAEKWYYFTGTRWSLSTLTVTPTAAVPSLDAELFVTRDGVYEPLFVDDAAVTFPETAISLNGTRANAFLTVRDTGAANGADTEFTVDFAQAALGGTLTESADVDVPIPDNDFITSTVDPDTGFTTVSAIHVAVDIGHTFRGDLLMELTSPSQITETVMFDSFDGTFGWLTVFTDTPPPGHTAPDGDFTAFAAETNPDGIWTLRIEDTFFGDVGTLHGWALSIEE